jgi:hypothetical protein
VRLDVRGEKVGRLQGKPLAIDTRGEYIQFAKDFETYEQKSGETAASDSKDWSTSRASAAAS